MQVESLSERHSSASGDTRDDGTARKNRRKGRETAESSAAALPERSNVATQAFASPESIFSRLWRRAARRKIPSDTGAVVYFIGASNGAVKIGRTCDLPSRFSTLRTSSPVELRLLFWVPGDAKLEHCLHLTLDRERRKGSEWFRMSRRVCQAMDLCAEHAESGAEAVLNAARAFHLKFQPRPWQDLAGWFDDDGNPLHEKARRWALNPKNRNFSPSQFWPENAPVAANFADLAPSAESRPGPGVGSLSDASRPIKGSVTAAVSR